MIKIKIGLIVLIDLAYLLFLLPISFQTISAFLTYTQSHSRNKTEYKAPVEILKIVNRLELLLQEFQVMR